ncbi:hypothetical protein GCM10007878_02130 [Marinospirillum insulare]|uniref:Uncharacterized protein n=1 Tax=Marinospirillum insulare TaxID=217169 RepID=A0ABQ5ZXR6_9GAMM|nr:hypothetical protein GCM10007878_02130 [Marinospirillum insulare]
MNGVKLSRLLGFVGSNGLLLRMDADGIKKVSAWFKLWLDPQVSILGMIMPEQ